MSGTIAAGSLSEIGFVAEPAFGSTPTGSPLQRIRDVSFSVNLQKEIYLAEERRSDRSRSDLQFGYHSLSGEVVGEMSLSSWDSFIAAALGGSWANPTPVELPIVVSSDPATGRITSLTSSFDINSSGIRVGDVFSLTLARSAAGLTNVLLTVMSTTASTIDVEAGTITTTVTAVTATRAYTVGKKTGIGTTNTSFTLERWLTDRGLYQQFTGVQFNQMAISVPPSGLVSIGFSVVGRTATTFSSTTVASTYTAAAETVPFTTINGSLYEGSRLLGIVTGAEILINNNMVTPQIVGTNLAPTIFFGAHADITGTMSVLFTGPDMYDEFINETETTLVLRLQNHSGALTESSQFINIVLPRIKYTGAEVLDGGEGAVTVTMPFVALTPLESKPFHGTQAITFQASNLVSDVRSFDFTAGLPSGWSISRASVANYTNSSGVLQSAPIDTARLDYDPTTLVVKGILSEPQRTNFIRNNTMVNAAAGTPGTLPTGWATSIAPGITRQVVGFGTVNGISYIDIRLTGTPTAPDLLMNLSFESATNVSAAVSEIWTESAYFAISAGSLTGVGSFAMTIGEIEAGGSILSFGAVSTATPTATLQRYAQTRTLSNASTTRITPGLWVYHTNNSTAVDVTLRVGMPQLERGEYATSVITTSNTGGSVTRSADRITYPLGTWWQTALGGSAYARYTLFDGVPVSGGFTVMGVSKSSTVAEAAYTTLAVGGHFSYRWVGGAAALDGLSTPNFGSETKQAFSITRTGSTHVISSGTNDGVPNLSGFGTVDVFGMLCSPWSGGSVHAGWIHGVTLYNYPMTATELRALFT